MGQQSGKHHTKRDRLFGGPLDVQHPARSLRKSSTAVSGVAQLVTRRMQVWFASTGWSVSNS
mgnify:FL=1